MRKKKINKVCITYPPFEYNTNYPLISLNRQFEWLKYEYYTYPIIPSYAATLLENNGINVLFLDTIARNMNTIKWFEKIFESLPDLLFFEVKTPIINYIWDIIEIIKEKYKDIYIVFAGDHVTALPEESMLKSKVDFILTGGDYDMLLLNLVNHLNNGEKLNKGIYYRTSTGNIKNTGHFILEDSLDRLPFINRNLTNWKLYSKQNTYYKKIPGTFIMSGRCSLHNGYNTNSSNILFNNVRFRNPNNVIDEIDYLNKRYNIKEIIDCSYYFPTSEWLYVFCDMMNARKLNKKVYIDCYIYYDGVDYNDYKIMKKSGFKTIIFNIDSLNNSILDMKDIGIRGNNIIESIKMASKAGLFTELSFNIGYPNETDDDIINSFYTVKNLMVNGYLNSVNVSLSIPYPGTKLFNYCKENNLIKTENWFDYDMRDTVIKSNISDNKIFKYIEYFNNLSFNYSYLLHRLFSIRDIYDTKYYIKFLKSLFIYSSNKYKR